VPGSLVWKTGTLPVHRGHYIGIAFALSIEIVLVQPARGMAEKPKAIFVNIIDITYKSLA